MFMLVALVIGAGAGFVIGVSRTLGTWTAGGAFLTAETLLYASTVVPAVVLGAFAGRVLFHCVPQQTFTIVVLALSAAGAVELLL